MAPSFRVCTCSSMRLAMCAAASSKASNLSWQICVQPTTNASFWQMGENVKGKCCFRSWFECWFVSIWWLDMIFVYVEMCLIMFCSSPHCAVFKMLRIKDAGHAKLHEISYGCIKPGRPLVTPINFQKPRRCEHPTDWWDWHLIQKKRTKPACRMSFSATPQDLKLGSTARLTT